jgi:hypothetical protein
LSTCQGRDQLVDGLGICDIDTCQSAIDAKHAMTLTVLGQDLLGREARGEQCVVDHFRAQHCHVSC